MFSFVSIDGDSQDFLRTVRKAAQDDELCGMFFISKPDFELHNFTPAELADVLWSIAAEAGVEASMRAELAGAIAGVTSAKMLFKEAAQVAPELARVHKGRAWGKRLMDYALDHPERPGGEVRPIIAAIRSVLFGDWADYRLTRQLYRVDSDTGQVTERGRVVGPDAEV
jgi:hypothetical protein